MTYRFGCEVTVKLPEPYARDEWVVDAATHTWTVDLLGDGRVQISSSYSEPWWAKIDSQESRELGLALIAAADYAENGGEDAGRDL